MTKTRGEFGTFVGAIPVLRRMDLISLVAEALLFSDFLL